MEPLSLGDQVIQDPLITNKEQNLSSLTPQSIKLNIYQVEEEKRNQLVNKSHDEKISQNDVGKVHFESIQTKFPLENSLGSTSPLPQITVSVDSPLLNAPTSKNIKQPKYGSHRASDASAAKNHATLQQELEHQQKLLEEKSELKELEVAIKSLNNSRAFQKIEKEVSSEDSKESNNDDQIKNETFDSLQYKVKQSQKNSNSKQQLSIRKKESSDQDDIPINQKPMIGKNMSSQYAKRSLQKHLESGQELDFLKSQAAKFQTSEQHSQSSINYSASNQQIPSERQNEVNKVLATGTIIHGVSASGNILTPATLRVDTLQMPALQSKKTIIIIRDANLLAPTSIDKSQFGKQGTQQMLKKQQQPDGLSQTITLEKQTSLHDQSNCGKSLHQAQVPPEPALSTQAQDHVYRKGRNAKSKNQFTQNILFKIGKKKEGNDSDGNPLASSLNEELLELQQQSQKMPLPPKGKKRYIDYLIKNSTPRDENTLRNNDQQVDQKQKEQKSKFNQSPNRKQSNTSSNLAVTKRNNLSPTAGKLSSPAIAASPFTSPKAAPQEEEQPSFHIKPTMMKASAPNIVKQTAPQELKEVKFDLGQRILAESGVISRASSQVLLHERSSSSSTIQANLKTNQGTASPNRRNSLNSYGSLQHLLKSKPVRKQSLFGNQIGPSRHGKYC